MGLKPVPNWWERFGRTGAGRPNASPGLPAPAGGTEGADEPGDLTVTVKNDPTADVVVELPRGLRIAAAWSWRLLLIAAAVFVLSQVLGLLETLVIPLAIALLLTALLHRPVRWLRRLRFPRSLATAVVLVGGIALVAGVLTLVIQAFVTGLSGLSTSVVDGIQQIRTWLVTGPLHVTQNQIDGVFKNLTGFISENTSTLTSYSLTTASTIIEVLTGLFVALFATFFFLRDGDKIWRFLTRMMPKNAAEPIWLAGVRSWETLYNYVRGTIVVAFIDSVSIFIGIWILNVPLALPLSAVIFLGAFIPVVGAFTAGAIAVLVALVAQGWVSALIVLAIIVGVQQIEGHLLQPLVLGRAVSLHPLAIVVALIAGITLASIIGALVAVPILAVLNTAVRSLYWSSKGLDGPPPPDPVPDAVGAK